MRPGKLARQRFALAQRGETMREVAHRAGVYRSLDNRALEIFNGEVLSVIAERDGAAITVCAAQGAKFAARRAAKRARDIETRVARNWKEI